MVSGRCRMMSWRCQMVSGRCHMVSGMWRIVSGRCWMVPGKCWMVLERCQMVSGRRQTVPGRCQMLSGSTQRIIWKTPGAPRVYFKRLLPHPEYTLKDSWHEAYVEHMEIRELHVVILFSPICGPMASRRLNNKVISKDFMTQNLSIRMGFKKRFCIQDKSQLWFLDSSAPLQIYRFVKGLNRLQLIAILTNKHALLLVTQLAIKPNQKQK